MIIERIKYAHYNGIYGNRYFWRTRTQQEIDYVEERDGKFYAFEFKLNPNKKVQAPKSFSEGYNSPDFICISPDNFPEILL
jgi:hypothetical protein